MKTLKKRLTSKRSTEVYSIMNGAQTMNKIRNDSWSRNKRLLRGTAISIEAGSQEI
jgi:hypothetical protein